MKTIIRNSYFIILSIILTTSLLYSQSTIVYDAGTLIDISTRAEVCADTIILNGIFSGNGIFCNVPVAIENRNYFETPEEFSLLQNYPNPFNPVTNFEFHVVDFGLVTLRIYDILGNEVATLVNQNKPAGIYQIEFDASGLSSGVYLYQLKSGSFSMTKKLTLMR